MQIPYELALGWRYTRAGRATRRNGFISFISGVSMLGIALGVAALIIVLSVMNGFQKEVRDRMLSVVSHIEIFAPHGAAMPDPARTLAEAQRNPNVVGAAPFVSAQALLARGEDMKGTLVRGIDPDKEGAVTDLAATNAEVLKQLVPGEFRVVLGRELARSLGARVGGDPEIVVADGQARHLQLRTYLAVVPTDGFVHGCHAYAGFELGDRRQRLVSRLTFLGTVAQLTQSDHGHRQFTRNVLLKARPHRRRIVFGYVDADIRIKQIARRHQSSSRRWGRGSSRPSFMKSSGNSVSTSKIDAALAGRARKTTSSPRRKIST